MDQEKTFDPSAGANPFDQKVVNVLKGLTIDGVHQAKSGHPGGAMSSMDFAYILFTEFLRFDPQDPQWQGRDRFVLSAGHESMLIYSLLHMVGWLPMSELRRFRQLGSKTPGHPENTHTPGVECTTGPLGQGAAMSVGMAIASRHLGARLDAELYESQRVYALLGDGCMQEDVTLGAASLAGHLGLRNLIWFYDQNQVQIAGPISRAFSDDTEAVFQGFGWQVIQVDGHDRDTLRSVLQQARDHADRPTLIVGRTVMAKGAATMEGSAHTHGSPLPGAERLETKKRLGLPDQEFFCPEDVLAHFRRNFSLKMAQATAWRDRLSKVKETKPGFAELYQQFWGESIDPQRLPKVAYPKGAQVATRNVFGDLLLAWSEVVPNLIGGSADLDPSNMTEAFAEKYHDFSWKTPGARNIAYGVREFPMAAVTNGISLFGGLIPFDATFLVFSDYARPALRLQAIQQIGGIHELTHDSFYLGEDGPTHQPVEHLMSLRLIPDFYVMRPADAGETHALFAHALGLKRPTALCLSRQKLPVLDEQLTKQATRGAYILKDATNPELLLLATGSEVSLALEVAGGLKLRTRVVSMPCWELFLAQSPEYQDAVLPSHCRQRVSLEAGATLGWQKFIGLEGLAIGLDSFGASGKAEDLAVAFGFTPEKIIERIQSHFSKGG